VSPLRGFGRLSYRTQGSRPGLKYAAPLGLPRGCCMRGATLRTRAAVTLLGEILSMDTALV